MNENSNLSKLKRFLSSLVKLFFVLDIKNCLYFTKECIKGLSLILRNKSLAYPSSKMCGRKCKFKVFGKTFFLDGKWFGYAQEIYARKVYFTPLGFRINSGDTIIDLGASGGIFTVLAALLGRKVIAVEANRQSFDELNANLRQNNCVQKVKTFWAIVGGNSGLLSDSQEENISRLSLSLSLR